MTSADEPRMGRRETKGRFPLDRFGRLCASVLLATGLSAAACGGEDSATGVTGPVGGSAGKAGASGGSGKAGSAGSAGKAGTGGTGGASGKGGASGTGGSSGAAGGGGGGTAGAAGSVTGGSAGATAGNAGSSGSPQAGSAGSAGSQGGSAGAQAGSAGSAGAQGGNGGAQGGNAGAPGGSGGQAGGNACPGTQKACADGCVPLNDPTTGCGPDACAPCAIANATPTCSAGKCAIGTCAFGFADCDGDLSNGCEVSIADSVTDCGKCGKVCGPAHAAAVCTDGLCGMGACDQGYLDCNGNQADGCEVASASNTSHCGGCGQACKAGEQCENGVCGSFCAPGLANCDGDATNGCETTLGTPQACGGCGDTCTFAGGTGTCIAGKCSIGSCNAPQADCDNIATNGCETNTQASTSDCGACGNACPSGPNASAVCSIGTCSIKCAPNFGDCDADPSTGCERPLGGDVLNCGACGVACSTQNGTPSCNGGLCQTGACNAGFTDCNNLPNDGCETNTGGDIFNCGGCKVQCPAVASGTPACITGQCKAACVAGFADCDNSLANGCEVNTQLDVNNCAGCGNVCNVPNAVAKCTPTGCGVAVCSPGFADCDGNPANGCEVNLASNNANCGLCGKACPSGGNIACVASQCVVTGCPSGFRDCNLNPGDGCEVNVTNDLNNCGACGSGCVVPNGTPACASGTCTVQACAAPFANCDNVASNGCEKNLSNDPLNCGSCGNVCSTNGGIATCNGGTCGISCSSGRGNCDGDIVNGCETDLSATTAHCGACGAACATGSSNRVATAACSSSSCQVVACQGGFTNPDGGFSNGCECAEDNVPNSCGAALDLGTVGLDGVITTNAANNLAGLGNDEDWYKVSFLAAASCNFNPRVTLNPGSGAPVKMQIFTSCSGNSGTGSISCGEGYNTARGEGIESWEYKHSTTCGDKASIDATPDTVGTYVQIPTTIYIRVYRSGTSITCHPYTLSIGN